MKTEYGSIGITAKFPFTCLWKLVNKTSSFGAENPVAERSNGTLCSAADMFRMTKIASPLYRRRYVNTFGLSSFTET